MEGLVRWNDDRAAAAVTSGRGEHRQFSDVLRAAANQLSHKVFGTAMDNEFKPPKSYTGKSVLSAICHCRLSNAWLCHHNHHHHHHHQFHLY